MNISACSMTHGKGSEVMGKVMLLDLLQMVVQIMQAPHMTNNACAQPFYFMSWLKQQSCTRHYLFWHTMDILFDCAGPTSLMNALLVERRMPQTGKRF